MRIPRFIDTIYGGLNYPSVVLGFFKRLTRPSKGGRLGPTVRCRVKRRDHPQRKPEEALFGQVTTHLEHYGVDTFDYNMDGYYHYFKVRKTQAQWAEWLYNGGRLRTPQKDWKNR